MLKLKVWSLILVFTMALSLSAVCAEAVGSEYSNVLSEENFSFENGTIQAGYQSSNAGKVTADAAHSGGYGVEITATGSIHNLRNEYAVRNTEDKWYRASYRIKAKDSASVGKKAQLRFQVRENASASASYSDGAVTTVSSKWQIVTNEYFVPANYEFRIGTIIESGAVVYVDDFKLEPVINLLSEENSSFESGKFMAGYQSSNAGRVIANTGYSGTYGAEITATGSIHNLRTEYKVRNTEDRWYRLSCRIRATDKAYAGKSVRLRFQSQENGSSAAAYSDSASTALVTGWQTITHEYMVPANHQMRVGLIIESGAVVYVDDFQLEPIANVLHGENPGFEAGEIMGDFQSANAAVITEDAAHLGNYGAEVTATRSIHNIRTQYKARNSAEQWYTASVWVKAKDSASEGKSINLRFQSSEDASGSNAVTSDSSIYVLTSKWQCITHTYKVPANHFMRLGLIIDSGAVAYVDDFNLEKLTPAKETLASYNFEGVVGTSPAPGFTNAAMTMVAEKINDNDASNGYEYGNVMQLIPHPTEVRTSDCHLSNEITKGIVEYSFDFYAQEGAPIFQFYLKDLKSRNVMSSYIYPNGIIGEHGNGNIIKDITFNKWHSIVYRLNLYEKSFAIIFDGVTYTTNIAGEKLHFRDLTASELRYATVYIYPQGENPDAVVQIDNYAVKQNIVDYEISLQAGEGLRIDDLKIYGLPEGKTAGELSQLLVASPEGGEIIVLDSEGNIKNSADIISKNDIVRVAYPDGGMWCDYKIMPEYRIDFRSLVVDGDEYFETDKITKPGKAKIKAILSNNTDTDGIFTAYASVTDVKLLDVDFEKKTIPAGQFAEAELEVEIPDNTDSAVLKLMMFDSKDMISPVAAYEKKLVFTSQKVAVPKVFSDGMVLQRDEKVNIFGIAPTGTEISVTFGDYTAAGVAENGEFLVQLPEMPASGVGKELIITAGDTTLTYTDVVVGDVFYGSGQSNMEMSVASFAGLSEKLGVVENVRCFDVAKLSSAGDREGDASEAWKKLDASNYTTAGATMYGIAASLRKYGAAEADVPIGFIKCAWGGTKINKWINIDAIEAFPRWYDSYLNSETDKYNNRVTDIYYSMVRSVVPYTCKAAVWYQGESDVYDYEGYDNAVASMINTMRADMGYDIPYFIVQLPGYGADKNWDRMRLLQWNVSKLTDKTYVVVTNDTGDATNIHPVDKDIVTQRTARQIMKYVYEKDNVAYSGPVYKSAVEDGSSVAVSFDFVNDGVHGSLCTMDEGGTLGGFELSADGETWYKAEAVINGDTIVLTSENVQAPAYVRYGWVDTPVKSAGNQTSDATGTVKLPLAPFSEEI